MLIVCKSSYESYPRVTLILEFSCGILKHNSKGEMKTKSQERTHKVLLTEGLSGNLY